MGVWSPQFEQICIFVHFSISWTIKLYWMLFFKSFDLYEIINVCDLYCFLFDTDWAMYVSSVQVAIFVFFSLVRSILLISHVHLLLLLFLVILTTTSGILLHKCAINAYIVGTRWHGEWLTWARFVFVFLFCHKYPNCVYYQIYCWLLIDLFVSLCHWNCCCCLLLVV